MQVMYVYWNRQQRSAMYYINLIFCLLLKNTLDLRRTNQFFENSTPGAPPLRDFSDPGMQNVGNWTIHNILFENGVLNLFLSLIKCHSQRNPDAPLPTILEQLKDWYQSWNFHFWTKKLHGLSRSGIYTILLVLLPLLKVVKSINTFRA